MLESLFEIDSFYFKCWIKSKYNLQPIHKLRRIILLQNTRFKEEKGIFGIESDRITQNPIQSAP